MLLSSGRKWGRDRRLLTRAFHFDVLRPYIRVYSEAASVLVVSIIINITLMLYLFFPNNMLIKFQPQEKWSEFHDGKSVDISPSIIACTLDVMLRCTCSYESNCQRLMLYPYFAIYHSQTYFAFYIQDTHSLCFCCV